jgi:hypothetical protein
MNGRVRLAGSALALCAVAAGGVVAGCDSGTSSSGSREKGSVVVTTVHGYGLTGDPLSAIRYPGNALMLSGVVVGREAPRKVEHTTPAGDVISYIYTPIAVRVERVWKGSGLRPGQQVHVRALGGQLGHEKTVSELGPAPDRYEPGMTLVLFAQPLVDAGDGLVATTPNFTYAQDSTGGVYNLNEPRHRTSRTVFTADLSEWSAFHR